MALPDEKYKPDIVVKFYMATGCLFMSDNIELN